MNQEESFEDSDCKGEQKKNLNKCNEILLMIDSVGIISSRPCSIRIVEVFTAWR